MEVLLLQLAVEHSSMRFLGLLIFVRFHICEPENRLQELLLDSIPFNGVLGHLEKLVLQRLETKAYLRYLVKIANTKLHCETPNNSK